MNRERLEYLIDILSSVLPEQFDIETWKCKTAACALGWACGSDHFQQQGLSLRRIPDWPDYNPAFEPFFEGATNYHAGALFFDLSLEQAEYLFCPDSYEDEYHYDDEGNPDLSWVTPAIVIARIGELLS